MILTPKVIARLAAIAFVAVILNVSFFSKTGLASVSADSVAAVTVIFGLLGGAVVGAVTGFAAGLLLDSILIQTLGASSLALIAAGYLAGRFRESFEVSSAFIPLIATGVFTMLGAAVFALLQLMLGADAEISLLVIREVILKGVLGVLLAIPLYPLIRRMLGPALIDYEPRGSRPLLSGFTRGASRTSRHNRIWRAERRGARLRRSAQPGPLAGRPAIIRSARNN